MSLATLVRLNKPSRVDRFSLHGFVIRGQMFAHPTITALSAGYLKLNNSQEPPRAINDFFTSCITLLVLVSNVAFAERATNIQALSPESRILAYILGDGARDSLIELGRRWDKKLDLECGDVYFVKIHPALVVVHKPIEFPTDSPYPVEGIWQYRFEVSRCASTKTYNAIVVAAKDTAPRYVELLPGMTIASPILMRDTLPIVHMKVTMEAKIKEKKECDDFAVKDTKLTVIPPISKMATGIAIGGRYEETWAVRYCGDEVTIPICFSPKVDGGTSFLTQLCKEVGK